MALPTFDNGSFQVTSLTYSKSVVAVGESVDFSITLKNVSGKSVSSCYIEMTGYYPTTTSGVLHGSFNCDLYLHGSKPFTMASISWGNNVSKTFTGTFTLDTGYYPLDETNYFIPITEARTGANLTISIVTGTELDPSTGRNYDNLSDMRTDLLSILSYRDNPRVGFSLERYPNDESTSLSSSLRLTADTALADLLTHGYTLALYRTNEHSPATTRDTVTTLNCTISEMYAGITDSTTAITQTVSNGSNWYLLLTISNGYESAEAHADVSRAFANLHLSGCSTGGACFGGFSSAAENDPKLESYYPFHPYGGIVGYGPKPGDTFTFPFNMPVGSGYITDSSKAVRFVINLGAPLANINSVQITGKVVLRCGAGYLTQATYESPFDMGTTSSAYTITTVIPDKKMGLIYVDIAKSTAWGNAENNRPISAGSGSTPMTLTFT